MDTSDKISGILIGILVGLMLFTMFLMILPTFCYANMVEIKIPLYAGYNNNVTSGNFFLGSGSINSTDMVFFWINEDGVKHKESRLMKHSSFIEDGGNYLMQSAAKCPSWADFMNGKMHIKNGYLIEVDMKSEFHVPENSIITMYQFK